MWEIKQYDPTGRTTRIDKIERKRIIDEINEIQARQIEIKPKFAKLRDILFRPQEEILEEILLAVKQLAEILRERKQ